MPLYEYQCRTCHKTAEVRHGFKETYDEKCADCGGEMARVYSPAGIVFKGPGFYLTDSRKAAEASASGSTPAKPAAAESSPAPASTESSSTAAPAAAPAAASTPAPAAAPAAAKSESAA